MNRLMRMKGMVFLVVVCLLCVGCASMESWYRSHDKYLQLYDDVQWTKETGLSKDKGAMHSIPLWTAAAGNMRERIGKIALGRTVKVLGRTRNSFRIQHPDTGDIVWVDALYVASRKTSCFVTCPKIFTKQFWTRSKQTPCAPQVCLVSSPPQPVMVQPAVLQQAKTETSPIITTQTMVPVQKPAAEETKEKVPAVKRIIVQEKVEKPVKTVVAIPVKVEEVVPSIAVAQEKAQPDVAKKQVRRDVMVKKIIVPKKEDTETRDVIVSTVS